MKVKNLKESPYTPRPRVPPAALHLAVTHSNKVERKLLAWALLDALDEPADLLYATNHDRKTPMDLSAKVPRQQLLDVRRCAKSH